jgi:hypothetical protein
MKRRAYSPTLVTIFLLEKDIRWESERVEPFGKARYEKH